ncbi:DUF438 domain-containing protein [Candidatus Bathyarchaeota archaeon]|nr:DUF438 domain-containing protein [Candidatus Bathyarchaeota archaeon]
MIGKEELKKILRELKSEEDLARVEEEARLFLRNIDPETLSIVEQELLEEGLNPEDLRRLCEIHLKAITIKREEPEIGGEHPIGILKAEHKIILDNIKILEEIASKVKSNVGLEQLNEEFKKLESVVALLLEAESHHQREEEALFPRLEKQGITGPPSVMRIEHEDLRVKKKALKRLLDERATLDHNYLADNVYELGNYIVSTLRDHIYKEDNILYPLSLTTIPENEWRKIREEFDVIGYCCFTPGIKALGEHRHEV